MSFLRSGPLTKVTTALAALVFFIVTVEGGTRLLGFRFPSLKQDRPSDRSLWVYDATKGWFHAPGAKGKSDLGGPDRGAVRINGLGLRGREISRAKRADVRRVLVFGDSFVFGVGVDEEHLFTSHLERLLGPGVEVVNMGVSGYSTDQEYILFQDLGEKLDPDLVILVVCDNDFSGNTEDFAYERYYKPYFELASGDRLTLRGNPVPRLSRSQRAKLWLAEESNLWNFFRSRAPILPLLKPALDVFHVGVPRSSGADPVAVTFALVAAIRSLADWEGSGLLLVNTGHRGEKTGLFQALRPRLRTAGIRFLGLEGNLGEARRQRPDLHWDFSHNSHWNVDSHRLAAEVVYAWLKQNPALLRKVRPGSTG